jgi:WbqC-like protein family
VTTLVVLQPGYLPWLGYFDLLQKADVFVHYDSGRAGQSILDVEIDDRQNWRRKDFSTVASRSSMWDLWADWHCPPIVPRYGE